jgi:hypothetical protein
MSNGVHVTDEGRGDLGGFDGDDFGRRLRQFAIDADRILRRPDGPVDEVIGLHRRAWLLLQDASAGPSSEIRRWLLATRRVIDARLLSWSLVELESSVD